MFVDTKARNSIVVPFPLTATRLPKTPTGDLRARRASQFFLALLGAGALLAVHAPALLCLVATVGVAAWWCREQEHAR